MNTENKYIKRKHVPINQDALSSSFSLGIKTKNKQLPRFRRCGRMLSAPAGSYYPGPCLELNK